MTHPALILALAAFMAITALPCGAMAAGEAPPLPLLWPGGAPGAGGTEPKDIPTLTLYAPPATLRTGVAIVICPGGGYGNLAAHEGEPVARWLNTLSVTAFVLRYRLAPRYRQPAMLQDGQQAVRLVRARAASWRIDPARIGILGFSAGGISPPPSPRASTAATRRPRTRSRKRPAGPTSPCCFIP